MPLSQQLKREAPSELAVAAREQGDAVRGAILFAQNRLGCAKCHEQGARDRLGPDLTKLGAETSDTYIVESLLWPSKTIAKGFEASKILTTDGEVVVGRVLQRDEERVQVRVDDTRSPLRTLSAASIQRIEPSDVSAMPADLADQLSSRQQFLDLTKYLMDLAAATTSTEAVARSSGGRQVDQRLQGLALIDHYRCTICHAEESRESEGRSTGVLPAAVAPHLIHAAGRIDPDYLHAFIANPVATSPGTSMPDVLADASTEQRGVIATAIIAYLKSRTDRTFDRQKIDAEAATRGQETYHRVGCIACHSPRDAAGRDSLAEESISLADVSQKYSVESLTGFLEEPHTVRPSGRMPNMKLTHWEAADLANYLIASSIPAEVEREEVEASDGAEPSDESTAETALVETGRRHFLSLGCVRCHDRDLQLETDRFGECAALPTLAELRPDRGCLADPADPSGSDGRGVRYDLTDNQRELLRLALREKSNPLSKPAQLRLAMETLRCFRCHQRGEFGGVSSQRDLYFHTTDPNLGPQGRIPPALTDIGAKLKPRALRKVMVAGESVRPYIQTRMPLYGVKNVEPLVALFGELDELAEIELAAIDDEKEMRQVGVELVGREGLNCVACHTFQNKPAQTMAAVDLTVMGERLQPKWFAHYMHRPQAFSPGTVMPSFWPGGKAIRSGILQGDTDRQIAAIWHYLQDGRQARTPRGLDIKPIELVAGGEAVMLRRSYPGIGKRGIGVGYPQQVNLAFDAEQMRLAMLWQGKFADPGGVWRSQGHGTVRPLSRDVIRFAAGPDLDDASDPWQVDEGRPPHHQFKGYWLDDLRRPAFNYSFETIDVEDYATDVKSTGVDSIALRRRLRFTTPRPRSNLRFRVASGNAIEKLDDHTYRLDSGLTLKIDASFAAKQVRHEEQSELVIPLDLPAGETELQLEYRWLQP